MVTLQSENHHQNQNQKKIFVGNKDFLKIAAFDFYKSPQTFRIR